MMKQNPHHTAADIAFGFGLHLETIRRYAREEGCPCTRGANGRIMFHAAEVHQWLSDQFKSGRPGRPDLADEPTPLERAVDLAEASRLRRLARAFEAALAREGKEG